MYHLTKERKKEKKNLANCVTWSERSNSYTIYSKKKKKNLDNKVYSSNLNNIFSFFLEIETSFVCIE